MSKVIVIDEGILTATAINNWGSLRKKIIDGTIPEKTFLPPVAYTWFMMAMGYLKRIGLSKEDTVIVARDKTTSWRKFFYPMYKAQRWELREKQTHIDWREHYLTIDKFLNQIDESTGWHVIWLPNLCNGADLLFTEEGQTLLADANIDDEMLNKKYGAEADDIIALASKYYVDKEVVFISKDADLDQLCVRENTKYFTITPKFRGGRGIYKEVKNGYAVLAKKIKTGDIADNIVPSVTDKNTPNDIKLRELIIDLLNIPAVIEKPVFNAFEQIRKKEVVESKLPFANSLAKKFPDIYKDDKIISYEDSMKHYERKKTKAKKISQEAYQKKKLKKQQSTMLKEEK